MRYQGNFSIWTNKQQASHKIFSHLDRMFVNEPWTAIFLKVEYFVHPSRPLGYCVLIIVDILLPVLKFPSNFLTCGVPIETYYKWWKITRMFQIRGPKCSKLFKS